MRYACLVAAPALLLFVAGCNKLNDAAESHPPQMPLPGQVLTGDRAQQLAASLCSAPATYERLKVAAFRQAAQVRGVDSAPFDRLAAFATVRVEEPLVVSGDQAPRLVRCTARMAIDLPPGTAAMNGSRSLTSDVAFTARQAADGSGLVWRLNSAEPIIYPLATLRRVTGEEFLPPPVIPAMFGGSQPQPGGETVPVPASQAPAPKTPPTEGTAPPPGSEPARAPQVAQVAPVPQAAPVPPVPSAKSLKVDPPSAAPRATPAKTKAAARLAEAKPKPPVAVQAPKKLAKASPPKAAKVVAKPQRAVSKPKTIELARRLERDQKQKPIAAVRPKTIRTAARSVDPLAPRPDDRPAAAKRDSRATTKAVTNRAPPARAPAPSRLSRSPETARRMQRGAFPPPMRYDDDDYDPRPRYPYPMPAPDDDDRF